jgi:streptogramin lyase
MLRVLRLLVFLIVVPVFAFAQPLKPGEWRSYTSMRTVHRIAFSRDSANIWVATSGGAFKIDLRNANAIQAYRTTDGLTENDVTAVENDAAGNVFFGERNGGFDVLSRTTGKIQKRLEIHDQPGLTLKSINRIYANDDRVYLATAFGLSVYNPSGAGYFVTTVSRIGTLPQYDSVVDVVESAGRIYVATREGVASASRTAELTIPGVWSLGHMDAHPMALLEFGGQVIVATDSGLYKFDGPDTLVSISAFGREAIVALTSSRDSLYALTQSGALKASKDLATVRSEDLSLELGHRCTTIAATSDGFLILGTEASGVFFTTPTGFSQPLLPPGPVFNDVRDLVFSDQKQSLFVAHGTFGLSAFSPSDSAWFDYPANSAIPADEFVHLVDDPVRDVVWASAFGKGLYKIHNFGTSTLTYEVFGQSSGIPPQEGTYIVPGGGIIDREGRYCLAVWAANGHGVACTSDGQTFTSYPLGPSGTKGISWGCITEDHEGNYWVGTEHSEPLSRGVFWSRQSDRAFGAVSAGPGAQIANTNVNAILTDQDDGIWCGNESGVQIISNPYAISQSSPTFYVRSVKLLDQQVVHAMTVDGVGNKWIGTERGIFVVSPDGTDSVAHFSTDNSPLIDDNVRALAIDITSGEIYAGTPSGISRFSTIFTSGKPDYSGIRVYPNPLVQTNESSPEVTIDGLVAGSTVKVFTLNGKLVATINGTSLGSTVKWDGRDSMGHAVASGFYLVSATSPGSGDNGEAKLVIVREKP